MKNVYTLYFDDSGTRHPSRMVAKRPEHGYDWFAFGGILVRDEDEPAARDIHKSFCDRWEIEAPLHSSEIRSRKKNFAWIGALNDLDKVSFYEDCL